MLARESFQKLGTILFWMNGILGVTGMLIFLLLPAEAKMLRRAALFSVFFFGLPAALGLIALVFEKLGWLKPSPQKSNNDEA